MSDLQHTLGELRRELRDAGQLAPEDRALLESTMHDIQHILSRDAAVKSEAEPAPGEVLEGAAVRLEAEHPGVAGAVRALVDALAKAGI
ncbi:MAG: hypothetical protein K0R70_1189 [Steroidobacteraceae bacterium]|jgi:hypothetical protein|nr:hypothetical protein [Steroidobacteraceae bacterium]